MAKSLGLPTQSYMALSDGPVLDAQAGAETFGGGADRGARRRQHRVGPGMLDFLLVFSLPKLVFDDELVRPGAALRARGAAGRRPAGARAGRPPDGRPAPDHGAAHDGALAERELYLPSPVIVRDNRESWVRAGGKDLSARAADEVDRRLARYRPVETDAAVDAEMRRIMLAGLEAQTELPFVPAAPEPRASDAALDRDGPGRGRRVNARRHAH